MKRCSKMSVVAAFFAAGLYLVYNGQL